MTPTNWPNPERPGVPMFPERDMFHSIGSKKHFETYTILQEDLWLWVARKRLYMRNALRMTVSEAHALGCVYGGACLTPTQIADMLAAERERAVSACLSQKEVFESPEYAGGPLGAVMERFACDQCIEEIRNLGAAP
ncbi:hypothetical protein [Acetobacter indonesiensis]|uniref:Uncharacterized protein n=1 Tax=Acetobacter indonesiensis TaxID=104101 RepID=A0A252AYZ7_9PROT|nr:hypothetical protein [Acetobacter indonesiensis]OUI96908.1 hypothetical protein HK17_06640 [Acetobacter indonesiensis]